MSNSKLDVSQMKKSGFQRRREKQRKEPESEQCAAYIHLTKTNVTTWWRKVRNSKTPPTGEQSNFLEYVIERCHTERHELQKWHAPKGTPGSKVLTEPSRCALLGRDETFIPASFGNAFLTWKYSSLYRNSASASFANEVSVTSSVPSC